MLSLISSCNLTENICFADITLCSKANLPIVARSTYVYLL